MNQDQSVHEAHSAMQESIVNWVRLLIATGGSLKPIKCFYHMILFVLSLYGRCKYELNKEDEKLDIAVPIPDGYLVTIEYVAVRKYK